MPMRNPSWLPCVVLLGLVLLLVPEGSLAQGVTLSSHHAVRLDEAPTALAFSSNGRFLLSGGENGRIVGWAVEQKAEVVQLRQPEEIQFLGFLPGDTAFVAVDRSGAVSIGQVDGNGGEVRFRVGEQPRKVALDAGRRYLAVATDEEQIHLFDLQAEMMIGRIDAGDQLDDLLFLGFDRLGKQLIGITQRGTVLTWNPRTQQQLRELALSGGELHGSQSVIQAVAANREGNVFVVGLQEVALPEGGLRGQARPGDLERRNVIIAYDWETGLEIRQIPHEDGPARQIALGPGSDHVAVTTEEASRLTLVNLRRGETGTTVPLADEPSAVTISENDEWLAAGTENGRLSVWNVNQQDQPTAGRQEDALPTLSGRIRVLSEKAPAIPSDTSVQLAVLPFSSKGESTKIAEICSDGLVTQLANVDHLTLLERERIDEVLQELNLQASTLSQSDGAKIGRLLGADFLVMGSLNALGSTYLFNARLLRVETAQITEGRQVICEECKVQDVFDAIHLLGSTIAQ